MGIEGPWLSFWFPSSINMKTSRKTTCALILRVDGSMAAASGQRVFHLKWVFQMSGIFLGWFSASPFGKANFFSMLEG